jgi:hypothetical protein
MASKKWVLPLMRIVCAALVGLGVGSTMVFGNAIWLRVGASLAVLITFLIQMSLKSALVRHAFTERPIQDASNNTVIPLQPTASAPATSSAYRVDVVTSTRL